MSRARRTVLIVSAAALLAAPSASAREASMSQVFVDPDTPAGKEYALPLESQRRQADPSRRKGSKVAQGEQTSPLFGEGITGDDSADTSGTDSSGTGSTGGGSGSTGAGSGATTLSDAAEEALRSASTQPGAPGSGTGTPLAIIGGAVVLLGIGGGIGVAIRRRAS